MKLYHLSIRTLVIRLFLIMAIVLAAGFGAYYFGSAFWFLTLLAFPVFLSCILGIEFEKHHLPGQFGVKHHKDSTADYRRLAH